jgi:hypothetical protein
VSRSDNDSDDDDGSGAGEKKSVLLPQLQSPIQKVKSGRNLVLHCAGGARKVRWHAKQITMKTNLSSSQIDFMDVSAT